MSTDAPPDPRTGIDALTGLGDLAALALRFPPDAPPVIAIWLDVDGLIWFNDSEGHPSGDAALATIGRWLLAACSTHALEGYRVAGDEFVLVRPATHPPLSVPEATTLADDLVASSPSLSLRFTSPPHPANPRTVLTLSALVFLADHRLSSDRRTICTSLADAIYAAGLASHTRYQRRASLLPQ